jgi:hypothetical protein
MILRTIGLFVCAVLMLVFGDFYRYIGVACLLYLALLPFRTVVAFNRVLKTNPIFSSHTVLKFGDIGIAVSAGGVKTELPWSVFTGWMQTKEHLLLQYHGQPLEMIIPKRAFNQQQLNEFYGYLNRIGGADRSS